MYHDLWPFGNRCPRTVLGPAKNWVLSVCDPADAGDIDSLVFLGGVGVGFCDGKVLGV
jgi:hypothetical protein